MILKKINTFFFFKETDVSDGSLGKISQNSWERFTR